MGCTKKHKTTNLFSTGSKRPPYTPRGPKADKMVRNLLIHRHTLLPINLNIHITIYQLYKHSRSNSKDDSQHYSQNDEKRQINLHHRAAIHIRWWFDTEPPYIELAPISSALISHLIEYFGHMMMAVVAEEQIKYQQRLWCMSANLLLALFKAYPYSSID